MPTWGYWCQVITGTHIDHNNDFRVFVLPLDLLPVRIMSYRLADCESDVESSGTKTPTFGVLSLPSFDQGDGLRPFLQKFTVLDIIVYENRESPAIFHPFQLSELLERQISRILFWLNATYNYNALKIFLISSILLYATCQGPCWITEPMRTMQESSRISWYIYIGSFDT